MKRSWILLFLASSLACATLQAPKATITKDEAAAALAHAKDPYQSAGGMWPYHNPPVEMLQKVHHFNPTKEWLESVRMASVRFPRGSASFVSSEGLVLTNHHVGLDSINKLSSAEHDYVKDGFIAKSREEELKCPGLALAVFVSYDDVTKRVKDAVKDGMNAADASEARRSAIADIEKESKEKTGLRSVVYNLYQGGEYWVYRYKDYVDVRLVFAPEQQIAFFGGDPDNFTYPRFNLDFSIFRVYEKGKPAATPSYFKFNINGAADGELVFVSGNPGSTGRLLTIAQLEYLRDHSYPRQLAMFKRNRDALVEYSKLGTEQARQAKAEIFGIENSIKAISGYLGGLLDKQLMDQKRAEEAFLKASVFGKASFYDQTIAAAGDTALAGKVANSWTVVEGTRKKLAARLPELMYSQISGQLAAYARTYVTYAKEMEKEDGKRAAAFREANAKNTMQQLFVPLTIYKDMEEAVLRNTLKLAYEKLGANNKFVAAALQGLSAETVARDIVTKTKLNDPEFRKQLFASGKKGIDASDDPMIQFARRVEPILQELAEWRTKEIDTVEADPLAKIADARFAVYGHRLPPDANFTLRLSPGVVKGYEEDTTLVPYKTTFLGLYERSASFDKHEPFNLPERWDARMGQFDMSKPFNFVNTCDIIGGNSGSPVINKNRELVGLIFDGNIQSLPNNFLYNDVDQRAVAVHPAAILISLEKIYDAKWIVEELTGK